MGIKTFNNRYSLYANGCSVCSSAVMVRRYMYVHWSLLINLLNNRVVGNDSSLWQLWNFPSKAVCNVRQNNHHSSYYFAHSSREEHISL